MCTRRQSKIRASRFPASRCGPRVERTEPIGLSVAIPYAHTSTLLLAVAACTLPWTCQASSADSALPTASGVPSTGSDDSDSTATGTGSGTSTCAAFAAPSSPKTGVATGVGADTSTSDVSLALYSAYCSSCAALFHSLQSSTRSLSNGSRTSAPPPLPFLRIRSSLRTLRKRAATKPTAGRTANHVAFTT
jgi:hypothetical protein